MFGLEPGRRRERFDFRGLGFGQAFEDVLQIFGRVDAQAPATAQHRIDHRATLAGFGMTPHVLRHTLAMDLLQNGIDRSIIALWLGHESVETTQIYLHANLQIKEQALAKAKEFPRGLTRYRPKDQLLAFLQGL